MLGEDLGAETHANDVDESLAYKKETFCKPLNACCIYISFAV
jgi:hypothetical protein